jgi:hypothetical protein
MESVRPRDEYLGLLIGVVLAASPAIIWHQTLPRMVEVLASMATALPWATSLFVKYYPVLFIVCPAAVAGAWWFWPNREMRGEAALKLGWWACAAEIAAGVVLMYLPIFFMGPNR